MNKLTLLSIVLALFCACSPKNTGISITPYPNEIHPGRGTLPVTGKQMVACDERADSLTRAAVSGLASQLATISGSGEVAALEIFADKPTAPIRFIVDETVPPEGYELEITRKKAEVRASDFNGFFYAIQTIKQMLPVEIYGHEPAPEQVWELPCVTIKDAPRFGYRGMHMDPVRHFFPVEVVKRYLDIMAVHKLNVLHWHLTDDQGWRIEIDRYPELTSVGSVRSKTIIRKETDNYDHTPHGGYFTKDEIREVVNYAASLGITVIPEIDLPGHMLAALTAYPHLGCTGGPYEVWGRWGVSPEVLCPGNEEIYTFLENVLTEVMELFPSEYIHIGGDECPKTRWEECPKCQARIKELGITGDGEHTAEHYLQSYVMARIEKFLNGHGRRVIGWDELLEGQVAQNATIMSWRGTDGGIAAAKLGHDVIMTPHTHLYFDYYQSTEQEDEPFGIGGLVPIEKVYSFEPVPAELTPKQQKHIIGVQANLWTEYIAEVGHLEYMLLPRLAALSEVQWCRPEVKDWNRFIDNFKMAGIYTVMGYNFAKHIYAVSGEFAPDTEKKCVVITLDTQGDAPIHYTTDGSTPSPASPRYTGPIEIYSDCTVKAISLRDDIDTPVYERNFRFTKSTCRPIVSNSAPVEVYTFGCPHSFVDGFYGKLGYTSGGWVGYHDEPMDVTIDMGGEQTYSSVAIETLIDKVEWVFAPVSITVSTSIDDILFIDVASLDIPVDGRLQSDGLRTYEVSFPETDHRYLRVVVEPLSVIPDWHVGKGARSFVFVSEIAVN